MIAVKVDYPEYPGSRMKNRIVLWSRAGLLCSLRGYAYKLWSERGAGGQRSAEDVRGTSDPRPSGETTGHNDECRASSAPRCRTTRRDRRVTVMLPHRARARPLRSAARAERSPARGRSEPSRAAHVGDHLQLWQGRGSSAKERPISDDRALRLPRSVRGKRPSRRTCSAYTWRPAALGERGQKHLDESRRSSPDS